MGFPMGKVRGPMSLGVPENPTDHKPGSDSHLLPRNVSHLNYNIEKKETSTLQEPEIQNLLFTASDFPVIQVGVARVRRKPAVLSIVYLGSTVLPSCEEETSTGFRLSEIFKQHTWVMVQNPIPNHRLDVLYKTTGETTNCTNLNWWTHAGNTSHQLRISSNDHSKSIKAPLLGRDVEAKTKKLLKEKISPWTFQSGCHP